MDLDGNKPLMSGTRFPASTKYVGETTPDNSRTSQASPWTPSVSVQSYMNTGTQRPLVGQVSNLPRIQTETQPGSPGFYSPAKPQMLADQRRLATGQTLGLPSSGLW